MMADVLRSSSQALVPPKIADGPPPRLEEPLTESKVQLKSSDGLEFSGKQAQILEEYREF